MPPRAKTQATKPPKRSSTTGAKKLIKRNLISIVINLKKRLTIFSLILLCMKL